MKDEVWGGVQEWGLADHSDGSAVFSIDPVCGKRVDEAKAAGKTGYAGVGYYFCSKECQRQFERMPGDYTGQPHLPSRRKIDINTASAAELKTMFPSDENSINHILENRPYRDWAEFVSKNPGFSAAMLQSLRHAGVTISTPNLNRML